jgi:hypothetical protein
MKKAEILKEREDEIRTPHRVAKSLDTIELFRTFKKYDRNRNGVLEFSEYT